jgi:hypothetical protein
MPEYDCQNDVTQSTDCLKGKWLQVDIQPSAIYPAISPGCWVAELPNKTHISSLGNRFLLYPHLF